MVARAELMSERLSDIQRALGEIRRRTEQFLEEGLTINQEANRVIEFADPIVFSIRRRDDSEAEDAPEVANAPEAPENTENG